MPKGYARTKEELQPMYTLPIKEAAEALGMGVTLLKRLCRFYDIKRWPQRKLASIDKVIAPFQESLERAPSDHEARKVLDHLEQVRASIIEDPNNDLDDFTKRLRQSMLKSQHTMRSHADAAAAAGPRIGKENGSGRSLGGAESGGSDPDAADANHEDYDDDMNLDEDLTAQDEVPGGGRNRKRSHESVPFESDKRLRQAVNEHCAADAETHS